MCYLVSIQRDWSSSFEAEPILLSKFYQEFRNLNEGHMGDTLIQEQTAFGVINYYNLPRYTDFQTLALQKWRFLASSTANRTVWIVSTGRDEKNIWNQQLVLFHAKWLIKTNHHLGLRTCNKKNREKKTHVPQNDDRHVQPVAVDGPIILSPLRWWWCLNSHSPPPPKKEHIPSERLTWFTWK